LSFQSDDDVISLIIENLVENAIIFRKKDSLETHQITIEVFEKENSIHLIVKDNGVGINAELHDQIYDMFFRGSDQSQGTGLGLYLVKMAVDKLNGSISIESEPDEFTEFTIQLPVNK
jgi:signal transduction histidine kinase